MDSRHQGGSAIPHWPVLDGIRGIAILLVLLLHFGVAAQFPARVGGRLALFVERVFYVGWAGVDLFFVLSGFLITSILLATKDAPGPEYYRRFYARRVLRIFPLYYIAIVITFFILPLFVPGSRPLSDQTRQGQLWVWTYLVNVAVVFGWRLSPDLLGHFWTLAIEEQYYFVWPAIVRKCSRRALGRLSVALLAGALGLRVLWLALGGTWDGAYRFTLTRVDAFAVGALVALIATGQREDRRAHRYALVAGLIALAGIFVMVPHFYPSEAIVVTAGHSLLAATFGALILVALQVGHLQWLNLAPLRSLGKYSYGIYVWHWPLLLLLQLRYPLITTSSRAQGLAQSLTFFAVGVGGSIVLGWVSFHAFEAPFLRMKRLVAYSAQRGTAGSDEPRAAALF